MLGKRAEYNEPALQEFPRSPRVEVLTIDHETADRWSLIAALLNKAGTPVAGNDIWIAAGAMQYGIPILTSDRDFQKILQVIVRYVSSV